MLPVIEKSNDLVEMCRNENKNIKEMIRRVDEILCEKMNKNTID